ncbi:phosphotransferase family protein [Nocardia asteroides]|uniref:phosphotransferase family protein n=1 Tax=Nocardia asteroides TaxID=1824 RepID=UPI001E48EA25|nr:aminoglycoside phosphotransferase family protein [Nocardia asteroides]UGT58829.1 aminoglycoside phosphotransferase family protein [Nocardia asteroides]
MTTVTTDLDTALHAACATHGLSPAGAKLIHHSSNAVYVLPEHGAVARISTGAADLARALRTRALTSALARNGFGATEPFPDAAPVVVDDHDVSFWTYYQQTPAQPALTSRELGSLLRQLHTTAVPDHVQLPRWIPLESLHAALTDSRAACEHLRVDERQRLLDMVGDVREEIAAIDWPLGDGLLHGDAWAGNLLWRNTGIGLAPILGDWDWASIGPLEVDLIPTWHAAIRFGRAQDWIDAFIREYGYDLRTFDRGFQALRRMRDLVQVSGPLRRASTSPDHAARLRQRVEGILSGDETGSWNQYR